MKLFITSAYPFHPKDNFAVLWLKESAFLDSFGEHQISEDPDKADVILFAEHHPPKDPYFFEVLRHPLYAEFSNKVILYNDCDLPIALIPSILPSIERRYYKEEFTRSAPYIARHCENDSIRYSKDRKEKKFLFSFIGAGRTHSIRKKILSLKYPLCFLQDTSDKNLWELGAEEKKTYEKGYVEVSLKSDFILCPRGIGVNTYRLYETMQMGVAPVIISDEWVPMEGPSWEKFAILVPERDIDQIPEILHERRLEAAHMGEVARENWEKWFAKEVSFHRIANLCQDLQSTRHIKSLDKILYSYFQFLRPFHSRNLLRHLKNKLI